MTHQEYMALAAQIWNHVKPEADPPFHACAQDHQFRLAYKVQSVDGGGKCEDEFDRIAREWLSRPEDVRKYLEVLKEIRSTIPARPTAPFNPRSEIKGMEHLTAS